MISLVTASENEKAHAENHLEKFLSELWRLEIIFFELRKKSLLESNAKEGDSPVIFLRETRKKFLVS